MDVALCGIPLLSAVMLRCERNVLVMSCSSYKQMTVDVLTVCVLILTVNSRISSATVRCYCNDAHCVNTGYICKSEVGFCYTALSSSTLDAGSNRWSSFPRGCVDFLPAQTGGRDVSRLCSLVADKKASASLQPNETKFQTELICCQHDLCNYADGSRGAAAAAAGFGTGTGSGRVDTLKVGVEGDYAEDDASDYHIGWSTSPSPVATELWFRATVIAVPVTGLLVLILLVIIAARLLHRDFRWAPDNNVRFLSGKMRRLSSDDMRCLRGRQYDLSSRRPCRCHDTGGVVDRGAGSRYEKMASSESVISGLTSAVVVADLLDDTGTSCRRLLNGAVGPDNFIRTFTEKANVSLV